MLLAMAVNLTGLPVSFLIGRTKQTVRPKCRPQIKRLESHFRKRGVFCHFFRKLFFCTGFAHKKMTGSCCCFSRFYVVGCEHLPQPFGDTFGSGAVGGEPLAGARLCDLEIYRLFNRGIYIVIREALAQLTVCQVPGSTATCRSSHGRASRRLAGYLGDLARGKREGDGEPAKSDWEDLQAAVLAGDTKALQVADAVMAQAKSRTDAERMEALGRLLQEESVEGPQEPQGPQQRQAPQKPQNFQRPLKPPPSRARQLVTSAVPISVACFAGCGSASLTDGRCEALQGLARPTFRPRVKRRRSTRALVLPKKPVNLVFALETWLEGTHQH
ncbi:unnamed protein product [Effrenium voratum]|nr:unnamed protein product [Effrenium voratum]